MGHSVDMSASSDLLWALTKKQNAFLVKRNRLQLSSEPGNLMNKNSFKYSGLANPARNVVSVDLKKDFRKVATSISSKTEGANYRKDLKGPALARWYKIWKSQQKAGAISKE